MIHLQRRDRTACGLRITDSDGWNRDPTVEVAVFRGTIEEPLRYEPPPTCPKCLATDRELNEHLAALGRQ